MEDQYKMLGFYINWGLIKYFDVRLYHSKLMIDFHKIQYNVLLLKSKEIGTLGWT